MKTIPIVKTAKETDQSGVIDALKLAFVADPATRWVWPDPQNYLAHFSSFAMSFGGKAYAHESAHYVGNYSGAALWLPPNIHPDADLMMELVQSSGSDEAKNDGPEVLEKMSSYHTSEPHWYLPLLGVDPLHHGKGLGSALLHYAIVSAIKIAKLRILNHQTRRIFRFTNDMDLNCLAKFR